MTDQPNAPASIEDYLDSLFDALGSTGPAGRRVLAEAEGHLVAAYEDGIRRGLDPEPAAAEAITRFGTPAEVAATTRAVSTKPLGVLLRQLAAAGWLIAGVGLVCLGFSGLLAELLGAIAGRAYLAADLPGTIYTPARCAEFFQLAPGSTSCTQAAVTHHFGEIVESRVAAGVLGVLVLMAWWLFVRRARAWRPPLTVTALVGAASAGLVALGSLGFGGLSLLAGLRQGFGATFTDAAAAAAGAVLFLVLLRRTRSRRYE